jgi:hypothetical protein
VQLSFFYIEIEFIMCSKECDLWTSKLWRLRQSHEDLYSPKGHWIRETLWRLITLLLSIFNWFWNRFVWPSEQLTFYRHVIGNTLIYNLGLVDKPQHQSRGKKRKNKEVGSMFPLYVLVCKFIVIR